MANNVKILIQTLYDGKGVKSATSDLEQINAKSQSLGKGLGTLAGTFGLVAGGAVAMGAALNKALDIGAEGAGITRIEESFQSLARVAGVSGDELLQALDKAARGTIANSDLILSTNRAMMLGLGADADQLSQLMEVAAFRGRAMGLSTTQAFNDIVTGVGRASPMILDNLGIVVDAESTYQKYADSIGKSASELTKAEKTQALLSRTIEEGQRQIEAAGGLTDDLAASYERLDANMKNATDTGKKQLSEFLEPLVEGWNRSFDAQERANQLVEEGIPPQVALSMALRETADGANDSADGVAKFSQQEQRAIDDASSFDRALMNQNRSLEDSADALEDNEDALKAQSKAYQTLLDNMFKFQDLNERFIDDEEDRAKKQKELEDEKVRTALETTKQKEDLMRDLAELDRDIAKQQKDSAYQLQNINKDGEDAASRRAKAESDASERQHDLMVRRQELLERIQELQDDSVVKQVALDEKLNELAEEGTKAIEDQKKARSEMVYEMLRQKAAQDDIITTDELRFLQDTAVQMGLVDRASADMAVAASEAADMMWEQFQKPGEAVGDIQAALNRVVQGSPYRAQIVVEQVGGIPSFGSVGTGASNFFAQGDRTSGQGYSGYRAEGGPVSANRAYIVGERGPELFVPRSSGEVIPNNRVSGANVTLNIANIRSLSDIDYLVQEVQRRIG